MNQYRCLTGKYKGKVFEWSTAEHEYVIKALPWMITPMVGKAEMVQLVKKGIFTKEQLSKEKEANEKK